MDNNSCINKWNYYCVTYDGNNLNFYFNGQFSNGMFADGNITNTSGPLQIAKRQSTNGNCALSNIHIYNRALLQNEIIQNYNALKNRFEL